MRRRRRKRQRQRERDQGLAKDLTLVHEDEEDDEDGNGGSCVSSLSSDERDEDEGECVREIGTEEKSAPPILRGNWEWGWRPTMNFDEKFEERRRATREHMESEVAACYSGMSTDDLIRDMWDYQKATKAVLSMAASLREARKDVRLWIEGMQEEMVELHRRW